MMQDSGERRRENANACLQPSLRGRGLDCFAYTRNDGEVRCLKIEGCNGTKATCRRGSKSGGGRAPAHAGVSRSALSITLPSVSS